MNKKRKRDEQANLEKEMILNPEKMKEKKKKRIIRAVIAVCIGLFVALGIIGVSFQVVRAIGKNGLQSKTEAAELEMNQAAVTESLTEEEEKVWQQGWIKYKGQIYAYNEEILTFLFMGIDKERDAVAVEEGTDGGQADALFLLVLNPKDKSIRVIGINRNTMTDVDLYNSEGAYMTTTTAQIAVQHGFGNGMQESCEYQVKAVRKLFYNLPIHGYCAINMNAVAALTDLVGGIELTALEDVKSTTMANAGAYILRKNETQLLDGNMAYSYVRYRDINEAGSADMRLKRQQQFLEEFIKKTKSALAGDISLAIKLYNAASARMVTDVSADEVTYLASIAAGYKFDREQLYSLKGETVMGEQFEEFYIDETALYEMILDIFYEPVER